MRIAGIFAVLLFLVFPAAEPVFRLSEDPDPAISNHTAFAAP
jgi:hypothetical protein